ncbi:CHAD domain-containing protein [Marinilabiliaceae bacterium JC017]|nr:CHAD domain-containing protein [Marinilabiliaceae bacterium JC017]
MALKKDKYRFAIDTTEELSEGLRRNFNEQFDYITYQCHQLNNFNIAVHEIRKGFKRVRAMLRIVRGDITEELYHYENDRFKNLAGFLSEIRDLHVIADELNELYNAGELDIPEPTFLKVNHYLQNRLDKTCESLTKNEHVFKKIEKGVEQARHDFVHWPVNHLGPHTITQSVGRIYDQGKNRMLKSQVKNAPLQLHYLRKRMKYLMYMAQLIEPVWKDYFEGLIRSLKEASDSLGQDHNWVATIAFIQGASSSILSSYNKQKMIGILEDQRKQLLVEIWPLVAKIYTEDPEDFVKRVNSYWLLGRQQ